MSVALPLGLLNHSLLRGLRVAIGLQGSLVLDASMVLVALMFQIRSYRSLTNCPTHTDNNYGVLSRPCPIGN